ncbi:MAG: hypothetical protein ACE5EB_00780 [Thermodesulfobacteriota bacterium]
MNIKRLQIILPVIVFFLSFSAAAYSDVTVKRFVKSGGVAGMGASEHYEKEQVKGLKKRVESTGKFTGGFLGKVTGTKKTTMIYDVKKDVVFTLYPSKKRYTERSITLPEEDSSGDKRGQGAADDALDSDGGSEVRVVKNELKMKDTGRKKNMNGFPCRLYTLTWLMVTENIKTGERTKNLMTGDYWTTPETDDIKALMREAGRFNRAYLKKMGLDMSPEEFKSMGLSILGNLARGGAQELKKEMARMKGYPIVTSVKWESESSMKEAKKKDDGIDIKNGVGGLLGSLSKKVVKKDRGKKKPVFDSYVEIKSIDTAAVSADKFSVPGDYRKKKSMW